MKLLLVEYRDWKNPRAGGAERALHEIFRRLASPDGPWRWEIDYLCSSFPGAPVAETSDGIRLLRRGPEPLFGLTVLRHLYGRKNRHRYDLVVEGIDKLPFFLPWFFPRLPVAGIVPHLLGETAPAAAGLAGGLLIWLGEALLPLCYRSTPLFPISESTRNELAARGLPHRNLHVIPYGFDTRLHTPQWPRRETLTFLYVGRLRRYKSLDVALRAFAAMPSFPGLLRHRFLIAGEGDDRPRLEALARELDLGDRVRFLGTVSEEKKIALMREATALLYPSRKEGWGLSVIEAAACGTPAIAADVPGLRDAVQDGKSGLLVPWGDIPAWSAAMVRIATNVQERSALSTGAISRADVLSWEASAKAMGEALSSVQTRL